MALTNNQGRLRLRSQVAGQEVIAQVVRQPHLVEPIVERLETLDIVAIDFETTVDDGDYDDNYGPSKGEIRLIQVGYDNPRTGRPEQLIFDGYAVDLAPLARLISNPDVTKVVHYSSFEQAWSQHHLGVFFENIEDTCFASQSINKELRCRVAKLIDPEKVDEIQRQLSRPAPEYQVDDQTIIDQGQVEKAERQVIDELQEQLIDQGQSEIAADMADWTCGEKAKLSDLCRRYLGESLPKEEQASDWGNEQLSDSQLHYAAADAAVTLALSDKVRNLAETLGVSDKIESRIALERQRMTPS